MASSSDEKFDMNICKACKQPFQRLKNHLRQKEDCQREYNMEAFDDQWKTYHAKTDCSSLGVSGQRGQKR